MLTISTWTIVQIIRIVLVFGLRFQYIDNKRFFCQNCQINLKPDGAPIFSIAGRCFPSPKTSTDNWNASLSMLDTFLNYIWYIINSSDVPSKSFMLTLGEHWCWTRFTQPTCAWYVAVKQLCISLSREWTAIGLGIKIGPNNCGRNCLSVL